MNIFDQVNSLKLPMGQYAVIGSGVMAAHGIRDFKDIDLLVTPRLYEKMKSEGWQEREVRSDLKKKKKGIFEASPDIMTVGNYRPDTKKLIDEADIINGTAFVRLEDVIDFKRAMGRPKDIEDIDLIEKYLNKKCR